ncbi:DDE-type integrase/transposase/recombinase [Bdellovibrionota bacterium FG-1]
MFKTPKFSPEQIDLIKSLLNSISPAEVAAPLARAAGMKGHRYSASEKATILTAHRDGKTQVELRHLYGVCHETLNRWVRRAAQNEPKAPGGATVPSSIDVQPTTTAPDEAPQGKDNHSGYYPHWKEVLKVWRSRPGLGPAQIKNQLHRVGIKVTVATVRKILEENGYTPHKAAVKEVEINRYEAVRPLEIVHMDFKHFYINKAKVYLLLFQDDFSRFLCGHRMTDSENMTAVIEVFEECVNRYGKMQTVMTDAGSAFYSWNGINKFQKLMSEEYGVDQIKASTPRSNGKIENVNKQIEKEMLDVKMYASLAEADTAIRDWIRFYNFQRTHMGLPPGTVPADRFLPGWNESGVQNPKKETEFQPQAANEKAWSDVLNFVLERLKRAA